MNINDLRKALIALELYGVITGDDVEVDDDDVISFTTWFAKGAAIDEVCSMRGWTYRISREGVRAHTLVRFTIYTDGRDTA